MQIKAISIFVLQISTLLAYAAPAGPTDQQPSSPVIPDAGKLATGSLPLGQQDATAANPNAAPGPLDFFSKIGQGLEAAVTCILKTPDVACVNQFTLPFAPATQNQDALTPAQKQLVGQFEQGVKAVSACMLQAGENMAAKKECWNLFQPQPPSPPPPATPGSSLNPQQQNFLDNITKSVKQSAACFTAQGVQATSCFDPINKTFLAAQQNPTSLQ